MFELGEKDIDRIERRVATTGFKNQSLEIDLVDHICCMIEERVNRGLQLQIAEDEVLSELGEVQLKAIDIETTILTQNKMTMTKRTKILGFVALGLMTIGFTFKMLHLPLAGITWGLGILLASFGFALSLMFDSFKYQKSPGIKTATVIGYLGAAPLLIGFGFKLLNWPIAGDLIAIGGFVLLIYFLLNSAFKSQIKEAS